MPARTQYARSGGIHIAYQVAGDGPLDLVYVPGWLPHVEQAWEEPLLANFLDRVEIRAGLHTGEVELGGDHIGGRAVNRGARVAANAEPGEVLVSSTVRDLVAGSGVRFIERGMHTLKSVPGEWRLFRAA